MENSNHKSANLEPVSPLSQLQRHSFSSNVENISLQQMNSTSATSTQVSHEQHQAARSEDHSAAKWPLRYRKRTLFWLTLYLIFLVVPWVFTCILNYRPLNRPSYIDQSFGLSPNDVKIVSRLMRAIRIMNSVATLVTIPFISIVLAHASIVYSQRRRVGQPLSLAQTLALADKRWGDVWFLLRSKNPKNKPLVSKFIWLGAAVLLLAAFQQPFQQLMISTKNIQVPTCIDTLNDETTDKSCHSFDGQRKLVGYDPSPSFLNQVPQSVVAAEIISKAAALQQNDIIPNIWSERSSRQDYIGSSIQTTNLEKGTEGLFASSLPELTATGILRYHALRMNSTVACTSIPREQFPTTCPGINPFSTSYSYSSPTDDESSFEVRVCAPGDTTIPPWTTSRDRQDILEEIIFLDVFSNITRQSDKYDLKYTVSCKASTTRGYFELGNERNNNTFGPLLREWPGEEVIGKDFNDEGPLLRGGSKLGRLDNSTLSPPPFITPLLTTSPNSPPATPGPLTTSTLALFGNSSFLNTLFQPGTNTTKSTLLNLCHTNTLPLQNLNIPNPYDSICQNAFDSLSKPDKYDPESPAMLALQFLRFFEKTGEDSAFNSFNTATLLANRALLGVKSASRDAGEGRRAIFSSPGMQVVVPDISLAGMIVVSVLVGVQVLVLGGLMVWIYMVRTWGAVFDAKALVGIGVALGREGRMEGAEERVLGESGIFGSLRRGDGEGGVELGLGREGGVGRRAMIG